MLTRLKKRMDHEIKLINDLPGAYVDNFLITDDNMVVYLFKNNVYFVVNMVFKRTYPFTPPYTSIGLEKNDNYQEILCNLQTLFPLINDLNNDITCLCCSSLVCKENWGPNENLSGIMKEISKLLDICFMEINTRLRKKIYNKYLGYSII